jgi:low affinity Fe/Cu permease
MADSTLPSGESADLTRSNNSGADLFRRLAHGVAERSGSAWAFCLALLIVVVWACSGPYFRFSDTWQLVINTGTTIVTFLMVFLIQNTQNRDGREMQLKLDELIRSHKAARNDFMDLNRLSDEELKDVEKALSNLRTARSQRTDTSS